MFIVTNGGFRSTTYVGVRAYARTKTDTWPTRRWKDPCVRRIGNRDSNDDVTTWRCESCDVIMDLAYVIVCLIIVGGFPMVADDGWQKWLDNIICYSLQYHYTAKTLCNGINGFSVSCSGFKRNCTSFNIQQMCDMTIMIHLWTERLDKMIEGERQMECHKAINGGLLWMATSPTIDGTGQNLWGGRPPTVTRMQCTPMRQILRWPLSRRWGRYGVERVVKHKKYILYLTEL